MLDWNDSACFPDHDPYDDRERYADYDYPELEDCRNPDCDGGRIVLETDRNWGADRDGNRGINISYQVCNVCGHFPEDFEDAEVL